MTCPQPPVQLDWPEWVDRWDRMQQSYVVRRAERFETIVRVVRAVRPDTSLAVDLGCGTGSLSIALLHAFQTARLIGIDFDPAMLWLAQARLGGAWGSRWEPHLTDLRDASWTGSIPGPVDAVVSATALHWFGPDELGRLYDQIGQILRPGGVFLNADHVGSTCPGVQRGWEAGRAVLRRQEGIVADTWEGFWASYLKTLGLDAAPPEQRLAGGGPWEGGVEEGLPLAWHLDRLRESGFEHVDCFWRCGCDAIYGGIRRQGGRAA